MPKISIDLQDLQRHYLEKLHPQLSQTMKQIQKMAKTQKIPAVCEETGRLLSLLSYLQKPKKILELGTGIAYSTHWLLLGHHQSMITSIEQNKHRVSIAKKFLLASGFLDRVSLKSMWIEDFFLSNTEKFDLIFLDSQKNCYDKMFDELVDRLKINGILVVDNSLFKKKVLLPNEKIEQKYKNMVRSIQNFNRLVFQHDNLKSFLFSLGDGILVTIKQ